MTIINTITKKGLGPFVLAIALSLSGCGVDTSTPAVDPGVVITEPSDVESSEPPATAETTEPEAEEGSEAPETTSDVFAFPKTCKADEYGWLMLKGKITNKSDETRTYYLRWEVLNDKGERVDEVYGGADLVAPGQTVAVEASGMGDHKPGASFTCKLLEAGYDEA